jgi:hypothetical protein
MAKGTCRRFGMKRLTHDDVRAYVRGLIAGSAPPARAPSAKIAARPFSKRNRPMRRAP